MAIDERINAPISRAELERRWSAVRAQMSPRGLDALVMQSANDWLGGAVKWFTDVPANNGYPRTVVFHAVDLMTVIEMGAFGGRRMGDGEDPLHPGVGEFRYAPAFSSVSYTADYDAELTIDVLKKRGCRKIGLINPGAMSHAFMQRLARDLGGAVFEDSTGFVDRLKAIKSDEEIALIRATARMQDEIFEKILAEAKPGMRDIEIASLAQREGQILGSEQGIFLGHSLAGPTLRVSGAALSGTAHSRRGTSLASDRKQWARRLLCRNRENPCFRQGLARAARRICLGQGSAGAHSRSPPAWGRVERDRRFPRRVHAAARTAAGDPPLLPRSGIRHGRAASDPPRRDDADRSRRVSGGSSRLRDAIDLRRDLRQLHRRSLRGRPVPARHAQEDFRTLETEE